MEEKMHVTSDDSNPFSLNDFPDELLLEVMIKLNDTSLLNMTRTCKRFRAIAKDAFGKSRENVYFELNVLCENVIDDEKRYRPFFRTFGANMHAIEIGFDSYHPVDGNHWIYDSLQRYASTSLKRLVINYADGIDLTKILVQQPSLTHITLTTSDYIDCHWTKHSFPNLKSFLLNDAHLTRPRKQQRSLNRHRNLDEFFRNNPQLIELSIEYDSKEGGVDFMNSFNCKLPNLQLLEVTCPYESVPNPVSSPVITIDKLEIFKFSCATQSTFFFAIGKGCKNIKKLKLLAPTQSDDYDDLVSVICGLEKLTKLKINACNIGVVHLQRIVNRLPDLTRLHLTDIDCNSDAFKSLPSIVASSWKLSKLKVEGIEIDSLRNLSHDFIKCMAEVTHLNINGLKVMLPSEQLVVTRGEVRRCKSIIYCVDNDRLESTLNLLDLSDRCLNKIISLLDANSHCALYNSCTRMRNLVKDYISSKVFRASKNTKEKVFHTLGSHISSISITDYEQEFHVLLSKVNRHCSAIKQLVIKGYYLTSDGQTTMNWPNLTAISISLNINYRCLRLFMCPMLEYLQINGLEASSTFDQHPEFSHLTTLKFGSYNVAVTQFLLALDRTICQQMKVLSLDGISDDEWHKALNECRQQKRSNSQLINIIMRFRNLSTLGMLVPGVTDLNTRYLFETCSKLISVKFCHCFISPDHIFDELKANCKELQFIHVLTPRDRRINMKDIKNLQKLFPSVKVQVDKSP